MPVRNARAREYKLRAQHCIDIAADLEGIRKVVLLEMAQAWLRLADQAERSQAVDLVYETPPPDRQAAPAAVQVEVTSPDPSLPSP